MMKLELGMKIKSTKTGKTYEVKEIREKANQVYIIDIKDPEFEEAHILNKVIDYIENGYYVVVKEAKSSKVKLTAKQLETLEQIKNAETQPRIIDKYNFDRYGKYEYINDDGKMVQFSKSEMWSYPESLTEVHMYKGHTSTLKALEKKGLITIISISEHHDIVTINKESKHITIPETLKQYEIIGEKIKVIRPTFYYATSKKGLEIYAKSLFGNKEYQIIETNQDFEVRYHLSK